MRILFFSSIFPHPQEPGLGTYNLHLCKACKAAGHAVRVMAPRSWLTGLRARTGILPDVADFPVDYPRYYYPPGILRRHYEWFLRASVGTQLHRTVAEFQPQCLVSYWAHPDGAVAVAAAREAGIPAAIMVGGSDVLILPREDPARGRRIAAALQAASAVLTVNAHLRERVIALGVAPPKVHVMYQGVDAALFTRGDQRAARNRLGLRSHARRLLFVGNLRPVKGLDVLLEACAQLRKQGQDINLYLAGDGPCRKALEMQVRRLGLGGTVFFLGSVAQRDLPDWYRAVNLTVMASHSEGLPNVLRESLACGTPFVATNVGGISEIAHRDWSTLVPPANPTALATAIGAWLHKPPIAIGQMPTVPTWAQSAARLLEVMHPLVASYRTRSIPPTEELLKPAIAMVPTQG